ncbi:3-deoxy-D-arabino-heptulosonate 7-phosphate synthase [Wielerella bovis]|uniref:3-deoxy-D-arabino-heptulosonate 7-phosphate synthase n=1 Tax=Wielerella bovis TaxID=2917790 RepID=UPI00201939D2|nr:3-deoxy-D-arabino-heptulosonate 7-phosphate synthase [Wielerella bovis]ULJ65442.1 3-deoxy-D-arabino-heptulosonate 7-phosphate synthase [Wielerella bovis]ULJ67787.1 3-deoxy-D-arabino-heptulosonate 7-phosphate synthase [Wielerella bovis]
MIIVMQANADETAIARVVDTIRQRGLHEHISRGKEHTIIGAVGDERVFDPTEIATLPQVQRAIKIMHDWRIISREAWAEDTQINIRGITIGGDAPMCYLHHPMSSLKKPTHGVLLDPFYRPSNPYLPTPTNSEKELTRTLLHTSETHHIQNQLVAIRLRDRTHIQAALHAQADLLYIGSDLADNRTLLHELGSLNIPIIICKAPHHSVRDWLMAAEQIVLRGNQHVILGESGTFNLHSDHLRLDIDAIVQARKLSHLPILADISQLVHHHMDSGTLQQLAQIAGASMIIQ